MGTNNLKLYYTKKILSPGLFHHNALMAIACVITLSQYSSFKATHTNDNNIKSSSDSLHFASHIV